MQTNNKVGRDKRNVQMINFSLAIICDLNLVPKQWFNACQIFAMRAPMNFPPLNPK